MYGHCVMLPCVIRNFAGIWWVHKHFDTFLQSRNPKVTPRGMGLINFFTYYIVGEDYQKI